MPHIATTLLKPGMILAQNVTARNGRFLLPSGMSITAELLEVLLTWGVEQVFITEPQPHDAFPGHETTFFPAGVDNFHAVSIRNTQPGSFGWSDYVEHNNLTSLAQELPPVPEGGASPESELAHLRKVHDFTLMALKQAAALGDFHADLSSRDDAQNILDKARQRIDGLILFEASAFFLMTESLAKFSLASCHPDSESARVCALFNTAVSRGHVAQAIWDKAPLLVAHNGGDRFLLHLMSTSSRVRGFFLGVLRASDRILPDAVLALLGNVLQNASNALESAELYAIFHKQNRELQSQVEERTAKLRETVGKLETEVAERREAQQNLARSLENIALILNNVHDAIIIYRPDGRVADVNEKMLRMFSVTREQAMTMRIPRDVSCPRRSGDASLAEWKDVLGKGRNLFEWLARRCEDDAVFPVEVFLRKINWNGETAVLAKIRQAVRRPMNVKGHEVILDCSIGVAMFPGDGRDVDSLIKLADERMYLEKEARKRGR